MTQSKIVIATANKGKQKEIGEILSGFPVTFLSLADVFDPIPQIPETGVTFEANALQKAQFVFDKTGIPAIADDSGLEVDFLDGRPGVFSARYAGVGASSEMLCSKLLDEMATCPKESRTARFRCVAVLVGATEKPLIAQGVCDGTIGFSVQGTDGFGYDPLFFPNWFDRTFAQLKSHEKNTISHRGVAFTNLKAEMNDHFNT